MRLNDFPRNSGPSFTFCAPNTLYAYLASKDSSSLTTNMSGFANTTSISTTKQHIPAWKRLGLKLKYAKDTAEESVSQPEQRELSHARTGIELKQSKRQRSDGEVSNSSSKPAKKRKASAESPREDRPHSSNAPPSFATATAGKDDVVPSSDSERVEAVSVSQKRARHKKSGTET